MVLEQSDYPKPDLSLTAVIDGTVNQWDYRTKNLHRSLMVGHRKAVWRVDTLTQVVCKAKL